MSRCEIGCECRRHHGKPYAGPNYYERHKRVRRARGSASRHKCVRCEGAASDWAQVHDTDGLDVYADYVSMCRSCNNTYDWPLRRDRYGEKGSSVDRSEVTSKGWETRRSNPENAPAFSYLSDEAKAKQWQTRYERYGISGRRQK